MTQITIKNTYGAVFGMDQMCDGEIPENLRVGDVVVLEGRGPEAIRLTVAALDANRNSDGFISTTVGIGLKGENAHLVEAGDVLTTEVSEDGTETCAPTA